MSAAPRSPTPSRGSHLTPAFERATVADAMHVGIVTCAPDAPLATVARTMASHHVHCIAVLGVRVENGDQLVWGTISALDLARAAWSGEDPDAGTMATTPAMTIEATRPLGEAVGLMFQHGVTHLVVIDRDARPIGVLSTLDVVGIVAWGRA
ncbi:MAG: CBS domain-containing protein [Solirubrobacteraceae bacterium]